jgi:uncharacterized RDD family membrane protein YckC
MFLSGSSVECATRRAPVAYDYRLETPEVVELDYAPAGIGSRFLAAFIDYLAILGFAIVLGGVCALIGSNGLTTLATVLFLTGAFLLLWGYFIIYETVWSGQTPGKRGVRTRVLKTSGYPIGFGEAVVRNLIRIVDFLPFMYGIGAITMFISPRARRLGDYAAGTIVVKEAAPVVLEEVKIGYAPAGFSSPRLGETDPDELGWDLRALSDREAAVSREFLQRAGSLQSAVRQRLGGEIAHRVAHTIGAREPLDPVQFLARVLELRGEA